MLPTVADLLSDPANQTLRLNRYDPDFRRYSYAEIIDCNEDVAELEALRRWSMVLHNQYPCRKRGRPVPCRRVADDDYAAGPIRAILRSTSFRPWRRHNSLPWDHPLQSEQLPSTSGSWQTAWYLIWRTDLNPF